MSRAVRVNELVLRELSAQLHTRFQERAVGITLTEVSVAPDLRSARVYYSALGDKAARAAAAAYLEQIKGELRGWLGKRVVLKYTPTLEFAYDNSLERGNRTLAILDDLAAHGEFAGAPPELESPPVPEPRRLRAERAKGRPILK